MTLVVTPPDREGFLFLNQTAAWIWQNSESPKLVSEYADQFDISERQAETDIRDTFAQWRLWESSFRNAESVPTQPVTGVETVIDLRINDTTFQVRFETEALSKELLARLEPLRISPSAPAQHTFRLRELCNGAELYKDGVRFAMEPLITGIRAILLQELIRLSIAERDFPAILHAGAVALETGAVILAGSSFSGKSTLCTALMEAGFLCLSDDSACLTRDFQVAGMPFALSLREGSWPLFPHLHGRRFIPSNLNGTSPAMDGKSLVFVNYRADATATTFEPVDTFSALIEIQKCGFWVEHTQPAISLFLDWLGHISKYRLTYSSLTGAVAEVSKLVFY